MYWPTKLGEVSTNMLPKVFLAHRTVIPLFNEVTEWSLLRKWPLSEVYRVRLKSGESRIVKWGGREMARESEIYRKLVYPLQIKAPLIFEFVELEESSIMIMEDAGRSNLEQDPKSNYFLEATRELARLRNQATTHLRLLPAHTSEDYFVSKQEFLNLLDDLLKNDLMNKILKSQISATNNVLLNLRSVFPNHLDKLYQTVPLSLVHHDYHAKNLVIQDSGIMPIDWSLSYLSPHLGDLYRLIKEAEVWSQTAKEDIISAFLEVAPCPREQLNWQIQIGGICWLIMTLHWLAHGGTAIIQGSDAWIPDLIHDISNLYEALCQ